MRVDIGDGVRLYFDVDGAGLVPDGEAMRYAAKFPNHASKLILSSCSARFDLAATVATFEQLGGAEAGLIARRFWTDEPDSTRADYIRTCLPLYTQSRGLGAERPGRGRP